MRIRIFLIAVACVAQMSIAQAQQPAARSPGRFVALTPPATPENSYPNFLWVVDTQTGEVVAYRIASATNPDGKGTTWVTERILTESEFYQLMRNQKKEAPAP